MKTKLKNVARFALNHLQLTIAVVLFAYLTLMFLYNIGDTQPGYTVGFNTVLTHVALALVYIAGGWDLREWREGCKP